MRIRISKLICIIIIYIVLYLSINVYAHFYTLYIIFFLSYLTKRVFLRSVKGKTKIYPT